MRGKLRYYFKAPKKAIGNDLLLWIAMGGMLAIAASSPYFIRALLRRWAQGKRYSLRSQEAAFFRMRKQGLLAVEQKGHRYVVSLTKKGREKARWLQLNALEVKKSSIWDKQWHFFMFDIPQGERWKRDILRSFLERLGFVLFQKSVWVHAYDPRAELEVLQEFLSLKNRDIKLVRVPDKGLEKEDSQQLCKRFGVGRAEGLK